MSDPNKRERGRPSKEEIAARGEPIPVQELPKDPATLPSIRPMTCICCGRGMVPKILRTGPDRRTISCSLCGRMMSLVYLPDLRQVVTKL